MTTPRPSDSSSSTRRKILDIVSAGLDLPKEEQLGFVQKEADGDEELVSQVMKILSADAGDFLDEPAAESSRMLDALDDELTKLPESVGRYKIVDRIGRGGMGDVYLGRHHGDGFSKRVAVKVVKRGMNSETMIRRFKLERYILGSLNHPNIARFLDAGTTEDGMAFFVMEFVDGIPITQFCDANKLIISDRLKLFADVCQAVHYAHQNLVVHRDLKPSNILVTPDGRIKLLDFGIAKLLNPDLAGFTVPLTQALSPMMTPEYASPEQIRGEPISTSTDVYGLGVLLYELLSGHRPFRTKSAEIAEVIRRVVETEPDKPSEAVRETNEYRSSDGSVEITSADTISEMRSASTDQLTKRLSGDLDNIIMKALRKEPLERYASVEQLREDITRYRLGRPVLARPASLAYRAQKYFARHKAGVTASIVATLAFFSVIAISLVTLSNQRDEARRAFQRAESVKKYVVGLLEQGSLTVQDEQRVLAAVQLLEPALESLDDQLEDDPESKLAILNVIGEVLASNNAADKAVVVLRDAQKLGSSIDADPVDIADTDHALSWAFFRQASYDSSAIYGSNAYEKYSRLFGPRDERSLEALKLASWSVGESDDNPYPYDFVVSEYEQVYGDNSVEVAALLSDIGQGSSKYWKDYFERALSIYRSMPDGLNQHSAATTMANLSLGIEASDPDRALALSEEAYTIIANLSGENHQHALSILSNVGAMYVDRGEYRKADSVLTEVQRRRDAYYPAELAVVAATFYWHGIAKLRQGSAAEAEQKFRTSLSKLPPTHGRYSTLALLVHDSMIAQDNHAQARRFLQQIHDGLVADVGPDHANTVAIRNRLS